MNPKVRDLLERDLIPPKPTFVEPPMEEDDPQQKNSCIPALIVVVLLLINGFASLGPMFLPGVKPMDPQYQAMWQMLLAGGVAYFINSTAKSAQKDTTIATLSKGQK